MQALVLGVNGQDGSYIAEHLLALGYTVCGVGRQAASKYLREQEQFAYISCDLADPEALRRLLDEQRPEMVFHFAAIHGSAGFDYESVAVPTFMVNLLSVQVILEYLRSRRPDGFLSYASSAKVFSTPLPEIVTEESQKRNSCLYSFTKNSAEDLINLYREKHGISASVAYLFQHESPRRAQSYFIPKICGILLDALEGGKPKGKVATLDFYGDWGAAQEYMEIVVAIARARRDEDFVLASGVTWHARKFVERLFSCYGLDWAECVEESSVSANSQPFFEVSTARLKNSMGQTPRRSILEACGEIIQMKSATT